MFSNRLEAGRQLAALLANYRGKEGLVLAIPAGGVPLGYVIAKELGFGLEPVLIKKIGHPDNSEYAIGAVGLESSYIVPHEGVSQEYINHEAGKIRLRLQALEQRYLGGRKSASPERKTIIIADDGMATGNTMLATVKMLQKLKPAKIILAVPVASESALDKLACEVDEVVCLLIPSKFIAVGEYYDEFSNVSEEEVIQYLSLINKSSKNAIGGLNMLMV